MTNEQVDLVAELEKLEDVPNALEAEPARGCRQLLSKCLAIPSIRDIIIGDTREEIKLSRGPTGAENHPRLGPVKPLPRLE